MKDADLCKDQWRLYIQFMSGLCNLKILNVYLCYPVLFLIQFLVRYNLTKILYRWLLGKINCRFRFVNKSQTNVFYFENHRWYCHFRPSIQCAVVSLSIAIAPVALSMASLLDYFIKNKHFVVKVLVQSLKVKIR